MSEDCMSADGQKRAENADLTPIMRDNVVSISGAACVASAGAVDAISARWVESRLRSLFARDHNWFVDAAGQVIRRAIRARREVRRVH